MTRVAKGRPGRVTLLKNYAPAMQHSMNAYADFLEDILIESGRFAASWRPRGVYRFAGRTRRPGFVLASFDKYAVAPLEAAFHSADVLHIADNSNAWYSFTSRYRVLVVSVHDMIPWKCANGLIDGWNPSPAARALLRLNLAAMKRADVLVAGSDTTCADLLAAGFGADRIRVIHHCNLNPPVTGRGERWAGVDLGETFVHFGAGKYPKHSELAIAAFELTLRAVPTARLLLVGPRASDLAATVSDQSAVQALDHIATAEVRYLYDRVAAVLMPSRYEGFGLPVLEAQETDCLIVTSNGGALDEVMQDGPLKLTRPIAAETLADTMLRILGDGAFREAMRESGRANAARFTRERAQRAYREFYAEIARNECL